MRKAFYASSLIPPKEWLIYASLVWEKIYYPEDLYKRIEGKIHSGYIKNNDRSNINSIGFIRELRDSSDIIISHLDTTEYRKNIDSQKINKTIKNYEDLVSNLSGDSALEAENILNKLKGQLNEMTDTMIKQRFTSLPMVSHLLDKQVFAETINNDEEIMKMIMDEQEFVEMTIELSRICDDFDITYVNKGDYLNKYNAVDTIDPMDYITQQIETIVPIDLNKITINQIVDFREATKEERHEFKDYFYQEFNELYEKSREKDIEVILKRIDKEIKNMRRKIKVSLEEMGILTMNLGAGVILTNEALFKMAESIGLNMFARVGMGAVLTIANIRLMLKMRESKQIEKEESKWAYLFNIEDRLPIIKPTIIERVKGKFIK